MTTQTSEPAANWWDAGGRVAVQTHAVGLAAEARQILIDACGPSRAYAPDGALLPDQELLRRARLATHPDRPEHRDGTALDRVLNAAIVLDLIKKPDRANQRP